jgi:hypothetical protein
MPETKNREVITRCVTRIIFLLQVDEILRDWNTTTLATWKKQRQRATFAMKRQQTIENRDKKY